MLDSKQNFKKISAHKHKSVRVESTHIDPKMMFAVCGTKCMGVCVYTCGEFFLMEYLVQWTGNFSSEMIIIHILCVRCISTTRVLSNTLWSSVFFHHWHFHHMIDSRKCNIRVIVKDYYSFFYCGFHHELMSIIRITLIASQPVLLNWNVFVCLFVYLLVLFFFSFFSSHFCFPTNY